MDEHDWESLKYWCGIFIGNRKQEPPRDVRAHLWEYLVTSNQNTVYIFVYLGKSLFSVPDSDSCFQNKKLLSASLKPARRSLSLAPASGSVCERYLEPCTGPEVSATTTHFLLP